MVQNCWEILDCGRIPGGKHVKDGICPVYSEAKLNGLNHGQNGGRICWFVSGTFCKGEIQGTFAHKRLSCLTCPVYSKIKIEEGSSFILVT